MFIAAPEDSDDTARIYKSNADSQGFVMNLTRAWAWRPDVFEGFAALRSQLTTKSSLSKREQAVIVCATAAELGDSYCSLAWGKTLAEEAGAVSAAALIDSSSTDRLNAREANPRQAAGPAAENHFGPLSLYLSAGFVVHREDADGSVYVRRAL